MHRVPRLRLVPLDHCAQLAARHRGKQVGRAWAHQGVIVEVEYLPVAPEEVLEQRQLEEAQHKRSCSKPRFVLAQRHVLQAVNHMKNRTDLGCVRLHQRPRDLDEWPRANGHRDDGSAAM